LQRNSKFTVLYYNARSLIPKMEYQVIRLDRNRHGGGFVIYVHNAISVGVLLSGPNELEFLAVSLCSPNSTRNHCIALLYRSPSCPVSFFDNFCNALHFLNPSRFTNFTLIGDFNIDFCNSSHPYFHKLLAITKPFSLSQVVSILQVWLIYSLCTHDQASLHNT